ncbi:MAG: peptidoglycan DD-metalloendopeptidase family protein [Zoogloeaceae bacterium]|jgi:lipoprotein NlpD|nr:peptidoglycan DD-metalloendopeptidase family protein [Zoogloeaceae bacterium]
MMAQTTFFRAAVLPLLLAGCVSDSLAPVENRPVSLPGLADGAAAAAVAPKPGYHVVQKGETLYGIALESGQDYKDIAAWNKLSDPNVISIGQVLRVQPPEDAVVTTPVAIGAAVEQRSLDGAPTPVAAAAGAGLSSATLKREPRVNKEPYSDAAYARAQQEAQTVARAPVQTVSVLATPPAQTAAPTSTAATATAAPPANPKPAAAAAATASGLVWAWPARGKTITAFSPQSKGIDIAGKAGDPVQAAADGRVVYAGNGLRGYGQLVIVKHNATYLSAYAHNRKIVVKEGQEVKRGEKIAEMGNTDSDAVKLHFEIRQKGNPVEPLQHLPKP